MYLKALRKEDRADKNSKNMRRTGDFLPINR